MGNWHWPGNREVPGWGLLFELYSHCLSLLCGRLAASLAWPDPFRAAAYRLESAALIISIGVSS